MTGPSRGTVVLVPSNRAPHDPECKTAAPSGIFPGLSAAVGAVMARAVSCALTFVALPFVTLAVVPAACLTATAPATSAAVASSASTSAAPPQPAPIEAGAERDSD